MIDPLNSLFLIFEQVEFSTDLKNWRPFGEFVGNEPRAFFALSSSAPLMINTQNAISYP